MTSYFEQVYAVVRCIPSGKVTTYGRIAHMLGRPRASRAVGYALNGLKGKQNQPAYEAIPWHRVINAQGRISATNREVSANEQAQRLLSEGVVVSEALAINLDTYLWGGLNLIEIEEILGSTL